MLYTPTAQDIFNFASRIGVENMYISHRYNLVGDILHELAHNAVCTNEQIARRTPHNHSDLSEGYLIPDIVYTPPTAYGRGFKPGIMSPNEFGTRVWALEVLQYFGWAIPPNTGNPCIYSGFASDLKDGEFQLREWGIEPLKGIFRPTKVPMVQVQREYY